MILERSFYQRSTIDVARDLIGKKIVREWKDQVLSGIIVETEAYCGLIDPASHAYRGQTERNKAMFGPVGHTYVYFIYGNHYCLNIVAREDDAPAGGVLIRALVPIDGIEQMKQWRNTENVSHIANGPGKIGQALHLKLSDNHIDVTKKGPLYITQGMPIDSEDIIATSRIGISKAQECLWRFVVSSEKLHILFKK